MDFFPLFFCGGGGMVFVQENFFFLRVCLAKLLAFI